MNGSGIIDLFNNGLSDFNASCFFARSERMQLNAIASLTKALCEVRKARIHLKTKNESRKKAKRLLSHECILLACISELEMIVELRKGESTIARSLLEKAKYYTTKSARMHKCVVPFLQENQRRLLRIEDVTFPPAVLGNPELRTHPEVCSTPAELMELMKSSKADFDDQRFIVRSEELLCSVTESLHHAFMYARATKSLFQENNEGNKANYWLSQECVLASCESELKMLIELKRGNPHEAWDHLIGAQVLTTMAARAHPEALPFYEDNQPRLLQVEELLFPSQNFGSPGMIVGVGTCSICNEPYGNCDHLENLAYCGEFCFRIIDEIERFDHLAMVKEPKSKKHRVRSITRQGVTKDWMTFDEIVFEPGPPEDTNAESGLVVCYTWDGS